MTEPPSPADEPTERVASATSTQRPTRASAAWVATAAALLLLILLIVFMLQNTARVRVHYFGLAGSLPLGMTLLIAAVAGGALVAIVGIVRITQLRVRARRARRRESNSVASPEGSHS